MQTPGIFVLFTRAEEDWFFFSWKDKFLMNVNVLSVPQFGRRDGTAWTASLRDTIDLLLVISFSFHYPVKHKCSLLVPLFQSLPYPQPAATARPRRQYSLVSWPHRGQF